VIHQIRPQRLLDHREYPVLYVDDEVENLRIFQLGFRREFEIATARSADEALQMLSERPFAVVLSDHRMPGMTGVELLARVREIDERVMRVLITAYGDAETLGAAINDGSIYKYIAKPWTPEELRLAIRRAIEVYALDREREELLRELATLNRISQTITQELELEPLLELLLETVTRDLGYDGATLLFLEGDGPRARLRAMATAPGWDEVARWLRGLRLEAGQAPRFFQAVAQGEVQTLAHGRAEEYEGPVRHWLTEVAADEMLALPLVGKGSRVIGLLVVDNRRGRRSFDAGDRTLLDGLATQAVIAIENARLVDALRRSREQVARADRLGTLGTLAAGLAHEINNPLTSIHTFLSLAPSKRGEEDPEFWSDYHALATREVERIRGLVASMERLGRGGGDEPIRCDLCDVHELAEVVARLLAREARSAGVELEVEHDSSAPKCWAVPDQVHQVLLNLLLNAIHASGPGGRVVVRVLPAAGDPPDAVALEVEDTGPGIDTEDLERIFDPFYTTKDPDQGTGLGLTICQQLVSGHGGSIEVRSRRGQGSTFRVLLPVRTAE